MVSFKQFSNLLTKYGVDHDFHDKYLSTRHQEFHLRVNCYGIFQASPIDGFDRWANSDRTLDEDWSTKKGFRNIERWLDGLDQMRNNDIDLSF